MMLSSWCKAFIAEGGNSMIFGLRSSRYLSIEEIKIGMAIVFRIHLKQCSWVHLKSFAQEHASITWFEFNIGGVRI